MRLSIKFSLFFFLINFSLFVQGLKFGVNLAGLEFGGIKAEYSDHNGGLGKQGWHYFVPKTWELDYYHSKGINLIRLPIKWERLQPVPMQPLREYDLKEIKALLNYAEKKNMHIIIDVHNYGSFTDINNQFISSKVGSNAIPHEYLVDFHKKLVANLTEYPAIYGWSLMNEPVAMETENYSTSIENWKTCCQKLIDGIRTIDTKRMIIVPGISWSSAFRWISKSNELKDLVDPSNNLIFEAHTYFDSDSSGTYSEGSDCSGVYPSIEGRGEYMLKNFVTWLRENNFKGYLGEFAVPGDDCWLSVLNYTLGYIVENQDVFDAIFWWSGGPNWGSYMLSLDPIDGETQMEDQPQMEVYEKFVNSTNVIPECVPICSSYETCVYGKPKGLSNYCILASHSHMMRISLLLSITIIYLFF